jgi:putative peptide zinc metalloprotease protein
VPPPHGSPTPSGAVAATSAPPPDGVVGPPTTDPASPSPDAVADSLPIPTRALGVELLGEMRGSGYREPPALVRRADGQTIQLTPLLYTVLSVIDGHRSYHEVAEEVGRRVDRQLTAEDACFLIEGKLRPLGVLRRPDGTEPEVQRANPLLALRFKVVVSDPRLTNRLTAPFAVLFRPPIVLAVLAAFALTVWWLMFDKGLGSATHEAFHEPHLLLLVVGLTILSTGFHEFGHAAACRYGGATPGAMGAGLYLVWPAFYTEVTDSYRLGRGGRLRVDLGGLYFNAVFGIAAVGLWWLTRWDALLLVVATQVLQMVRQLTPLVRFDGYHILADLTGVPDLFHHIKPILLSVLPSRWGRPENRALKRWARVVVTLWVAIVVPVLAAILIAIVYILPRLAATAWEGLGVQVEVLGQNWADGDLASVGVRVLSMLTLAIPVLSVTYLVTRIVRRAALKAWAASAEDPWKRAGVVAAGVLLVAGVAFAWWPSGQYEPVGPDDRGAVQDLFDLDALPAAVDRDERAGPATDAGARPVLGPQSPADGGLGPASPGGQPRPALVLVPLDQLTFDETRGIWVAEGGRGFLWPDAPTWRVPPPVEAAGWEWDGPAGPWTGAWPPASPTDVDPDETAAWPFPWAPPQQLGEDDNRALAVVTEDGGAEYAVAVAYVWVLDGETVDHHNEAWALASCVDCTAVAVAFQAVFIVGGSDVVAPVNAAVAATYDCEGCVAHAVAVQLVVTLTELPDAATLAELERLLGSLSELDDLVGVLSIETVYAVLRTVEAEILQVLAAGGYLDLGDGAAQQDSSTDPDDPPVEPELEAAADASTASDHHDASEGEPLVDLGELDLSELSVTMGSEPDAGTEHGSASAGADEPPEEAWSPSTSGGSTQPDGAEDLEHGEDADHEEAWVPADATEEQEPVTEEGSQG